MKVAVILFFAATLADGIGKRHGAATETQSPIPWTGAGE